MTDVNGTDETGRDGDIGGGSGVDEECRSAQRQVWNTQSMRHADGTVCDGLSRSQRIRTFVF